MGALHFGREDRGLRRVLGRQAARDLLAATPEPGIASPPPSGGLLAVSSRGELAILLTLPTTSTSTDGHAGARLFSGGGSRRQVLEDVYRRTGPRRPRPGGLETRRRPAFQLEYPIGTPIIRPRGQGSPFRFSPKGDKLAILGDEGLAVIDRAGRTLARPASAVPSQAPVRPGTVKTPCGCSPENRRPPGRSGG